MSEISSGARIPSRGRTPIPSWDAVKLKKVVNGVGAHRVSAHSLRIREFPLISEYRDYLNTPEMISDRQKESGCSSLETPSGVVIGRVGGSSLITLTKGATKYCLTFEEARKAVQDRYNPYTLEPLTNREINEITKQM